MAPPDDSGFDTFLKARRPDLQRITRATRGGREFDEVVSEAWMIADHLQRQRGHKFDLTKSVDQEALLGRLYVVVVRRQEATMRYAIQLDHGFAEDDDEGHPLVRTLAADGGSDPLSAILQAEQKSEPADPSPHTSLAAAYAKLLRHFDNDIPRVALHLIISVSQCRVRIAFAQLLADYQIPLPPEAMTGDDDFLPRAWRRFLPVSAPAQLQLNLTLPLFNRPAGISSRPAT